MSTSREKISFAQPLKDDIHKMLGMSDYDVESIKDDIVPGTTKTLRDYYIEHGANMRRKDIDYWCKQGLEIANLTTIKVCDFTDTRFQNEIQYCSPCITTRLFRREVPIPDYHIVSEHSLDTYKTDFLLVNSISSLIYAYIKFPQYLRYSYCGFIVEV